MKLEQISHSIQKMDNEELELYFQCVTEEMNIRKDTKYIAARWHIEDVQNHLKDLISDDRISPMELSDKEAKEILNNILDCHDAEQGINWDIIKDHIAIFIENKKG